MSEWCVDASLAIKWVVKGEPWRRKARKFLRDSIAADINVIYHGYREQLTRVIDNVRHWLKHGGIFYFTCPTRQDGEYGKGKELAPHTFELEPGHLHYCADETDLDRLLVGFKQLSRKRREHQWEKDGVSRFSSRWQILVEKL